MKAMKARIAGRYFLVQWQTDGAESWVGKTPTESVGVHMKGLVKGDHIFVSSCDDKELFLLGAMKVTSLSIAGNGPNHGKPLAAGETLAGPFQRLPLRVSSGASALRTRSPQSF